MTISNEFLDELLTNCARPEDLLGEAGLMKELKLQLMERSLGLQHWFAKRRDSHGSARFASAGERAAYQTDTGLLIGRDRSTGKLLRYDGPVHLLTLAPTRSGEWTKHGGHLRRCGPC